jgi:hypothetical protein
LKINDLTTAPDLAQNLLAVLTNNGDVFRLTEDAEIQDNGRDLRDIAWAYDRRRLICRLAYVLKPGL